ncbi:hypothetical protein ACFFLM_21255 [Deinococcus oregonensis]|uniref:Uncharacterized protein n=1 Tax=Deinococcus oregonensis TaxID=1805970 RepID=A0ABV6B427_9DEIO
MTPPSKDLFSAPDGKVLETLTDSRTMAVAAGVTVGAAAEKALWRSGRAQFGVSAMSASGEVVYYAPKADGTADTTQPHPQFRTNRNVARAAGVVACVAGIEFSNNKEAQYGFLGAGAIFLAHIVQDVVPFLR